MIIMQLWSERYLQNEDRVREQRGKAQNYGKENTQS